MKEPDEMYKNVIEFFSVCTNENPKDHPSADIAEALKQSPVISSSSQLPELPIYNCSVYYKTFI